MKLLLLILALLDTSVSFAHDDEDDDGGYKYGLPDYGTVYEPDGSSSTRIGDYLINSDGTVCVTVGNSIFCD